MAELLDQVREIAEGQIDFEGQKLAEMLATILLTAAGAIAFIAGYLLQDIKLAVYIALGGTAVAFLVVVPPWPFYKQHPLQWLPVGGGQQTSGITVPQSIVVDEKALNL